MVSKVHFLLSTVVDLMFFSSSATFSIGVFLESSPSRHVTSLVFYVYRRVLTFYFYVRYLLPCFSEGSREAEERGSCGVPAGNLATGAVDPRRLSCLC